MVYDHDHGQAVVISLKKGEGLKKHVTPVDVMFYILEGTGMVEIGDEVKEVGRDMVIESPAAYRTGCSTNRPLSSASWS